MFSVIKDIFNLQAVKKSPWFWTGLVVLAIIGAASHKFSSDSDNWEETEYEGHDNLMEEYIEELIESQIGFCPDLTPESDELR